MPKKMGLQPLDLFEVALLHRPSAGPVIKALAESLCRLLDEVRQR